MRISSNAEIQEIADCLGNTDVQRPLLAMLDAAIPG
jgi:hypothetical protein